ncbi:MAG TPA: hypothetical protein PLI45_03335 [Candidatus Woesebacteria bacterium]|nr:hypothetical protein [Candidatus Woesebacteria bacterium]
MSKKIKILLTILALLLFVALIIAFLTPAPKETSTTQTIPVVPTTTPTVSILRQSSSDVATKTKTALLPKLPINIKSFPTSVGINTDISISSYPNDDPDVVRIEVYGIDYIPNQNDPSTNPYMVAYQESFQKAISLLTENGVNIKDLHVSLSHRQYIRDVAETWIKTLNLLP